MKKNNDWKKNRNDLTFFNQINKPSFKREEIQKKDK